ncbi:hypothetical protein ANN_17851 [Periplaneta americana]|uniref:Uncharacterized protein n=1 Tax=Periplaneta americana TaxID=6978 RepID=A0ABQ8SVB3_PERAM|nr:hypothetical protein ANN_17851 [Periplaneta americana]
MSPGSSTESYPAFARIGLRENSGKNLNQVTCPDQDPNPGHLVSWPDALTITPQVWTDKDETEGIAQDEYSSSIEESLTTQKINQPELNDLVSMTYQSYAAGQVPPGASSVAAVVRNGSSYSFSRRLRGLVGDKVL